LFVAISETEWENPLKHLRESPAILHLVEDSTKHDIPTQSDENRNCSFSQIDAVKIGTFYF